MSGHAFRIQATYGSGGTTLSYNNWLAEMMEDALTETGYALTSYPTKDYQYGPSKFPKTPSVTYYEDDDYSAGTAQETPASVHLLEYSPAGGNSTFSQTHYGFVVEYNTIGTPFLDEKIPVGQDDRADAPLEAENFTGLAVTMTIRNAVRNDFVGGVTDAPAIIGGYVLSNVKLYWVGLSTPDAPLINASSGWTTSDVVQIDLTVPESAADPVGGSYFGYGGLMRKDKHFRRLIR